MRDNNIRYLFNSARHTNVNCPTHLHDTMEIVLVTSGTLCMEVGGKVQTIPAGKGVFIQPFEPHNFKSYVPNTCHVFMFSGELVASFFQFCKTHVPTMPLFTPSKESMLLSDSLLPDLKNEADAIKAQAALAPLCYEIYSQCKFVVSNVSSQDALAQALTYIHNHFTEPLTSKQVAQLVGVHPVTFSKAFNRNVGFHFNTYLSHLRCSHAAMLLKTSDHTVADIAFSVGFGTIRSFNRAFLTTYGITPSEYRTSPII